MKKFNLKYLSALILIASFLLIIPSFSQKKIVPPDYFPLAVGYWWQYKNVEKGWDFTIKVTGTEKIGDILCYKLETTAANDKVMIIQYYSKTEGKVLEIKQVYASSNNEAVFEPSKEYLHNPLKTGDSWIWKGKGMMSIDIEESNAVGNFEKITVPAGTFSAVKVSTDVKQGGQDVKKEYYYAPCVGLIKSHTDSGGIKSTLELVKYNLKAAK